MNVTDRDRPLLREIQRDGAASVGKLAERAGMAQSTAWRKLQEFEAEGVIRARVGLLDPKAVGANLCVFATVSLEDHSEKAVREFGSLVGRLPEIMECHALSGTADYILKIRVADVEAYEAFMTHNLLRNPHIRAVVSSFSLKEIKSTTELPI